MGGERVDLDAVQARYDAAMRLNAAGPPEGMQAALESLQDVPALVAELRAACEAAAALAVLIDHFTDQDALAGSPLLRARQARAAYDQATTP